MTTTTIDENAGLVIVTDEAGERRYPLASAEGFAAASRAWLRAGWDAKYVYSFTWMGRPVIQLPEDMLRLQELVYRIKPTLIIETGIAHGGSLIFYASLFKAMGHPGRVVGVDIEIRPHNRAAMEAHELFPYITMIEGSSVDPGTIGKVRAEVRADDTVLVLLDSHHAKEHVLAELEAYAPLVSVDSYIVACDGVMRQVAGGPRTQPDWTWNNPSEAARAFAGARTDFVLEEPPFAFNEGVVRDRVTYWPEAFLRRVR